MGGAMVKDVSTHLLDGITLKTGDLIATINGGETIISGQFWWLVGKLLPGDVDHIVIYVGPGGRCVEAGATGKVMAFEFSGSHWDGDAMLGFRGFVDRLYGVADPLAGRGLSAEQELSARLDAANYCLEQAAQGKPYNLNFLDSKTEDAFYCSQLAYKAYLRSDIDLNTSIGVLNIPFTESIIFPQEVWERCNQKTRPNGATE
jgi:hypothetical protein